MKKRQLTTIALLAVIIIGGFLGVKGIQSYTDLKTYRKQVNDITISNVDVSKVADRALKG